MKPERSRAFMSAITRSSSRNRLLLISFAAFLICYTLNSIRLASRTPYWMDEVLAVWTSRLPSATAIYEAIKKGAEFSPPTYHLILHYLAIAAGGGRLTMRAPSIAAALFAACCLFVLCRRYLGMAAAVFASCFFLESIRAYALQARPYALVVACFTLSVLMWDSYNRLTADSYRARRLKGALIAVPLLFAISLHFYSIFLVCCVAAMEILYSWHKRTVRPLVLGGLVCAGASILLWTPLIHAFSAYNAGDANGIAFYARPSAGRLMDAYRGLLFPTVLSVFLLMAALSALTLSHWYGKNAEEPEQPDGNADGAGFWIALICACALPVIVFIGSLFTKAFNDRYVIAAAVGLSAWIAAAFSGRPAFRKAMPLIAACAAILTLTHRVHYLGEFDQASVFRQAKGSDPIVIADGVQFFPLEESAPEPVRSRLVYLTVPGGVPIPDATNQHQIERWHAIRPSLPVEDVCEFLNQHRSFYVLDTQVSDDTPARFLFSHNRIELAAEDGPILLYKSRSDAGPEADSMCAAR